jgi:hypothetical protein
MFLLLCRKLPRIFRPDGSKTPVTDKRPDDIDQQEPKRQICKIRALCLIMPKRPQ